MALELCAIAFNCPDPRALAEFYGRLLGWEIDEDASDDRWVELADPGGGAPLAFQRAERYRRPTWPDEEVPQQVHVDIAVESLQEGHELAIAAGAEQLPQPPDRAGANFRVYADPAGHPFCVVATGAPTNE